MPAAGQSPPWEGYSVYVLVDPLVGDPVYVGMTSQSVLRRLQGHRSDVCSVVYDWLRKLRRLGWKPRVRIVAQDLNREQARDLEREYIARHGDTVWNRRPEIVAAHPDCEFCARYRIRKRGGDV